MKGYLLIVGTIFFSVLSQLTLKFGEATLYFPKKFSFQEIWKSVSENFSSMYVISFLLLSLVAVFFWVLLVQKMPLNYIYPFMSLNYVLIYFLSYIFFQETINITSSFGMLLIVIGTALVGVSRG